LQKSRDFPAQLPRPVKKTEDKEVPPVIVRTVYCPVCRHYYYNLKMQCPMVHPMAPTKFVEGGGEQHKAR
jgi:hypothetical protein